VSMPLINYIEKIYVISLLFIVRILANLGGYRIALKLYPFNSSFFSGVQLRRKYLDKNYGLSIQLNSKDLIDHKILFTGVYEKNTNNILTEYIKEGDLVIEAGANSGTETLLISRLVGNDGKVFAFEPVPHIFDKLSLNLKLNKISNVESHNIALGNNNDKIPFQINSINHPNQGMGTKLNIDFKNGDTIYVKQRTLDSFWESNCFNENIAFLKMDIQGGEFDLLKGAAKVLTNNRPKIFLEASKSWSNLEFIYDLLIKYDYSIFLVNGNLNKMIEIGPDKLLEGNWLALQKN
jgi:FkbM family methyltransferase